MDLNLIEGIIKEGFSNENGPGDLPVTTRTKELVGVLVPPHNGPVMAWGYKEIAESRFPGTYILLLPGTKNAINISDLKTLFGNIMVNKELASKIKNKTKFEYSEFQVPDLTFLQFVSKQYLHSLKVLPIMIKDFSYEVSEFLSQLDDVIFIVITDLSSSVGGVFKPEDIVRGVDQNIIKLITESNESKLIEFCSKKGFNFGSTIATLIEISRCKFTKPDLLMYGVFQESLRYYGNCSMVFR